MAGYRPPHEIVAVLRPGNYTPSSTGLLEQKYIVKDELEMVMEVKQLARSKDCPAKLVDKKVKKTSLHNDIHGLYVFPLREASWIFKKSGVYQFNFSVVSIVTFSYGISCKILFLLTLCCILKCFVELQRYKYHSETDNYNSLSRLEL